MESMERRARVNDDTRDQTEPAQPPPRPTTLAEEDRRLLAALLDELIGETAASGHARDHE